MTKYLKSDPFTVGMPAGQKYRDSWEATFGKKDPCPATTPGPAGDIGCALRAGHGGRCLTGSGWEFPAQKSMPETP